MKESLHYLIMANHLAFQKSLLLEIKDTGLTPGQPKILWLFISSRWRCSKEIAEACHIEPATLTSVLLGMEKKGFIVRRNINGNRRSLYVYLTDKGKDFAELIKLKFRTIEKNHFRVSVMMRRKCLLIFYQEWTKICLKKEVLIMSKTEIVKRYLLFVISLFLRLWALLLRNMAN